LRICLGLFGIVVAHGEGELQDEVDTFE
jgi:hypothetical protein